MNLTKEIIGTRHFGTSIDITDPCYNKDVWCRLNNVEIQEGDYECSIWRTDGSDGWGKRVAKIQIALIKDLSILLRECIGGIGVDAGIAGFFENKNKPDFSDEEWEKLCDFMGNGDVFIKDLGFWSSSGYGDGSYDIYAYKNGLGVILGLEIEFIEDEDEDEGEEDFNDENDEDEDNKFEIYWDDLNPKCQKDLFNFLGENGNYDAFPIVTLYKNEE